MKSEKDMVKWFSNLKMERNIEEPALTRKEKDFLEIIRYKPDEIFLYRVEGNNLLVQTLFSDIKFYIDPKMFPFIREGSGGMSFERLCELRMVGDDDRVGE